MNSLSANTTASANPEASADFIPPTYGESGARVWPTVASEQLVLDAFGWPSLGTEVPGQPVALRPGQVINLATHTGARTGYVGRDGLLHHLEAGEQGQAKELPEEIADYLAWIAMREAAARRSGSVEGGEIGAYVLDKTQPQAQTVSESPALPLRASGTHRQDGARHRTPPHGRHRK